ncbi:MAG TPA: rhomboid family intramembrane serine protease [Chromatiales bacterium]|nr:rhomboid family intramembrane serine protease [Thiotrichales bacterium]HIP67560.1 rhomboid family intramembrane serine protease [Chromatiales bacterium]
MNNKHKIKDEIRIIILFITFIWLVFLFDLFLPLEQLGLRPRTAVGVPGIIAMPFLHADFRHIMSNTPPLFILLTLLAGSRANSKTIVFIIILLAGLLLWLFGRGNAIHIGASGLVFGLAGFLIASGILEKRPLPLLISLIIGLIFGASLFAGILPTQKTVSWDGHLFGLIAGVITAWGLLNFRSKN